MSSAAQAVAHKSDIGGAATASDVSAIDVSPKPTGIDEAAKKSVRRREQRGNVPRRCASLFDAFDGHILSGLAERDHSARLVMGLLFEWSEPELDAQGKVTGWYRTRARLSNLARAATISKKTLFRVFRKLEALEALRLSRREEKRLPATSDANRNEVPGDESVQPNRDAAADDANASAGAERRIDGGRRQKGTFVAGNGARAGKRNDPVVLFRFFLGDALTEIDRRLAAGELVVKGGMKPMIGVFTSPAFDGYSRSAKTVYAMRFAHSNADGVSRTSKDGKATCTACGKPCPSLTKCRCGEGEGRGKRGGGSLPLRSHLSRATVLRAEADLMTARCSAKEAKKRRLAGDLELAGDGAAVLERRVVEVLEGGSEATKRRYKRARFRNLVLPQGGPHGQWMRIALPLGVRELPVRPQRTGQIEIGVGSNRDPRWDKMRPEAVGEAGEEATASPSTESPPPRAPAPQANGERPASPSAGHKSASPTGVETSSTGVKVAIPQRERPVLEAWFRTRSKAPFDSIDFARFATDRATRAIVQRWLAHKVITLENGIEEEVTVDQLVRAIRRWQLDSHYRTDKLLFVMASPRRVEELLDDKRWKRKGPKDERLDASGAAAIKASSTPAKRIASDFSLTNEKEKHEASPTPAERIETPSPAFAALALPTCGAPGVIARPANTTSPPASSPPAPISIDGLFFDEDGRRKPQAEIKKQLDAVLRKQLFPKPDFDSTKRSR